MGIEIASDSPHPLNFRVAKRIQDCGLDLWERVTKDSPLFMRAPFLQALEEGMPDTLQPRYGILMDKDMPVAVLVGQILTLYADRIPAANESRSKILQSAMEKLHTSVALWGNILGWGYSGIAFAPGADKAALWPKVAEAIHRAREEDKDIRSAGIHLVLDISDEEAAGATTGVVYAASGRFDHLDHRVDDRFRCVELAAAFALGRSELADAVFVDAADQVEVRLGAVHVDVSEKVDQAGEHGAVDAFTTEDLRA